MISRAGERCSTPVSPHECSPRWPTVSEWRSLHAGCWRSLSEREREVLVLIGQGMSNAEIGGTLHLSEATVKGYVSSVLGKIGAVNRVQAALVAYRGGLIA